MPPHPISGPEPSSPRSATGALRAQPEDASFETDFADLAARFSAQSGGGLSPELSADLALEIVLNELVEQACLATGATGAAIVLPRDGEMVCRASSGSAPELGARLDVSSGLSGEAVRMMRTQRCDDVATDPRADAEASKRLGIRSAMVMPLVRRGELVGVFELFSSEANAFSEHDESTLDALGGRALNNLQRAAEQLEAHPAKPPVAEDGGKIPREFGTGSPELALVSDFDAPPPRFDFVTAALGTAVLITALLLGIAVGRHYGIHKSTARARTVAHVAASQAQTDETARSSQDAQAVTTVETADVTKKKVLPAVPPGGLVVSQDGKEIFRVPPGSDQEAEQGSGVDRAALTEADGTESAKTPRESIVSLSPQAAESSVMRRVEPQYPEQARAKQVQGAVVLDVQIGTDGAVRNVQVVSGAPLLAQASTDAVKQWKFKTRRVNGRPAEMQTRVTLNFRLPPAN